jgi:hypothetical protein
MSLSINYVSSLGHRGPKSTRVNFGPLAEGLRLWAWLPNPIADTICEGMAITGEFSVRPNGAPEVSFIKDGAEVAKRVPTQQVWVNGTFVFDAPSEDIGEAPTYSVSEQAIAYRDRVLAKRAQQAQAGDDTPI